MYTYLKCVFKVRRKIFKFVYLKFVFFPLTMNNAINQFCTVLFHWCASLAALWKRKMQALDTTFAKKFRYAQSPLRILSVSRVSRDLWISQRVGDIINQRKLFFTVYTQTGRRRYSVIKTHSVTRSIGGESRRQNIITVCVYICVCVSIRDNLTIINLFPRVLRLTLSL